MFIHSFISVYIHVGWTKKSCNSHFSQLLTQICFLSVTSSKTRLQKSEVKILKQFMMHLHWISRHDFPEVSKDFLKLSNESLNPRFYRIQYLISMSAFFSKFHIPLGIFTLSQLREIVKSTYDKLRLIFDAAISGKCINVCHFVNGEIIRLIISIVCLSDYNGSGFLVEETN